MDPLKLEKFEAMKTYKENNNSCNSAVLVYIFTALICSMVFLSPFWYPYLEPILTISHLTTPKSLFILWNFIVFFLVGESELLTSKPSQKHLAEIYHDEYLRRSQSLKQLRPVRAHKVAPSVVTRSVRPLRQIRKGELIKGSKEGSAVRRLSGEELNKRADDFIARVNRQRRLEADELVQ